MESESWIVARFDQQTQDLPEQMFEQHVGDIVNKNDAKHSSSGNSQPKTNRGAKPRRGNRSGLSTS